MPKVNFSRSYSVTFRKATGLKLSASTGLASQARVSLLHSLDALLILQAEGPLVAVLQLAVFLPIRSEQTDDTETSVETITADQ